MPLLTSLVACGGGFGTVVGVVDVVVDEVVVVDGMKTSGSTVNNWCLAC